MKVKDKEKLKWIRNLFKVLQSNEVTRSTSLFIDFISISDKTTFEKNKSKVSKLPKPKSLADTFNLNGKVMVGVTSEKANSGDCIDAFSKIAPDLYNHIMKANKVTVNLMEKLAIALKDEANAYKELASLYLSIDVLQYKNNSPQK